MVGTSPTMTRGGRATPEFASALGMQLQTLDRLVDGLALAMEG